MKTLTAIATSADQMLQSANIIAHHINTDTDMTEQGKSNAFATQTSTHSHTLDDLTKHVDTITTELNEAVQKAWDAEFPTATTDTGILAAEMQAQRLLNRPALKDASTAITFLSDMEASPVRTIIVDELEAQGVLTNDYINSIVRSSSPDFVAVIENHNAVNTVLNNVIRPNLRVLEDRLSNRNGQFDFTFSIGMLGDTKAKVPHEIYVAGWQPTQAERLYRARG